LNRGILHFSIVDKLTSLGRCSERDESMRNTDHIWISHWFPFRISSTWRISLIRPGGPKQKRLKCIRKNDLVCTDNKCSCSCWTIALGMEWAIC